MWRDSTSRTFFGESCSLVLWIVGMAAPRAKTGGKRAKERTSGRAKLAWRTGVRQPPAARLGRRYAASRLGQQRGDARVLEAGRRAAVLAVVLGAVERRIRGAEKLVLLLLDGGAGRRVRADRGESERGGDHALEVQGRLVEAVGAEEERRAADRVSDRL